MSSLYNVSFGRDVIKLSGLKIAAIVMIIENKTALFKHW